MLVGSAIGAKRVFDFSGQFSIVDQLNVAPLLRKYYNDIEKAKFYILDKNTFNTDTFFFHFYPAKSEWDLEQLKNIRGYNLFMFAFNESKHGKTVQGICYKYLLTESDEKLLELQKKFAGKYISSNNLTRSCVPFIHRMVYCIIKLVSDICKIGCYMIKSEN